MSAESLTTIVIEEDNGQSLPLQMSVARCRWVGFQAQSEEQPGVSMAGYRADGELVAIAAVDEDLLLELQRAVSLALARFN